MDGVFQHGTPKQFYNGCLSTKEIKHHENYLRIVFLVHSELFVQPEVSILLVSAELNFTK